MKYARCFLLLQFLIAALTQPPACAYESYSANDTFRNFRQLERDIPSLYLINGLYLSKEQTSELLEIDSKAAAIETRFRRRTENLFKKRTNDREEQIDGLIERVAKGKGLEHRHLERSGAARRLRRASVEIREMRREKSSDLDDLADKLYELLSPSQRHIVDTFVPCFIPPHNFRSPERVGQAAGDTSFTERALERIRRQKRYETEVVIQKALDRLVPHAMQKTHMKYSEAAEKKLRSEMEERLRDVCERMSEMSDSDFELERSSLAAELLPPNPKERDSGGDRGAVRWKIRRYILNTGVMDVLSERSGESASDAEGKGDVSRPESLDMRQAFRIAGVFAALDVSTEQSGEIVDVIRRAVGTKNRIERQISDAMVDAIGAYHALRYELSSGQTTREKERAANHHHHVVKSLHDDRLTRELLQYEAELDMILTSDQVDCLSTAGKKPLRHVIDDGKEVSKALEDAKRVVSKARRMLPFTFKKEKEALCTEFIEKRAAGLEPGAVSVDDEVKRACAVLDRARKMSHVEYASKRADLAVELCPRRSSPRPTLYGHKYDRGRPVPELSPSSRLLFSNTAIAILERMTIGN